MKPKTSIKLASLWTWLTVLALFACKKEANETTPAPVEDKKYLNIVLHPNLKPTEVDSTIAK